MFFFHWKKWCEIYLFKNQTNLLIHRYSNNHRRIFLLDIQIRVSSSGYVNVLQWNKEWFFSRRVKLDSGFNVMAAYEVSWHGPEIIYRFTAIRKWVVKWWKRPFWFYKEINVTFSSNWSISYRGGCSQVLISSKKFNSSICGWKNKFSIFFGKYHLFRIESCRVDFRCVHRLQLLKVCDQYVTLPNSARVTMRIQGTIQARLSLQIDGFLTGPSQL